MHINCIDIGLDKLRMVQIVTPLQTDFATKTVVQSFISSVFCLFTYRRLSGCNHARY